ncbi:MAG: cytochrome c oxidase assembly protein [Rhodospirillales bacterium]
MGANNTMRARNRRVGLTLTGIVASMVALSFASAPLYRLFCQVTGFGGATVRADRAPAQALDRVVTVRFNADTDSGLPWEFKPAQREIKVRLGELALAFYTARNLSGEAAVGTATFNVTPEKAGGYFDKLHCFCFDEQKLGPGQTADLPVSFFVDPAMANERNLDDVNTITLSYTFFRAKGEPARASAAPAAASIAAPIATGPVN